MSCLGVHFAITDEEATRLRSIADEQERLEHLQDTIEKAYFESAPDFKAESDKSWDAMRLGMSKGMPSHGMLNVTVRWTRAS